MDYRDLETFLLGELDPRNNKDSSFQGTRDKSHTMLTRNNNNHRTITVKDSNQNLYLVKNCSSNSGDNQSTNDSQATVISRNPNDAKLLKLDADDHRLPTAEDFFTSVIKETSKHPAYVERDASDDFFAIKSPVHRISTDKISATVSTPKGFGDPVSNAIFDTVKDTSGVGDINTSNDDVAEFFQTSSNSSGDHSNFSITSEPTTAVNEALEQALFR